MRGDIVKRIEERFKNPDLERIHKIKGHVWTHNIPLSDNDSTCGVDSPLMEADMRVQAIRKHICPFLGDDYEAIRVLDLGSFEGGLSFEMARLGMDVTGIEGREPNYLKSKLIEEYFGLPNLRFIHGDVNGIDRQLGEFQLVLCCGVLYHMENPFHLLRKIVGVLTSPGVLFLDTHYAPSDEMLGVCTFMASLSPNDQLLDQGHSYVGRWYMEGCEHPWAALTNPRSFWPAHRALIEGLFHTGFGAVYELFGTCGRSIEEENHIREKLSRSFFIAQKV